MDRREKKQNLRDAISTYRRYWERVSFTDALPVRLYLNNFFI
jgi:hypothetical protein